MDAIYFFCLKFVFINHGIGCYVDAMLVYCSGLLGTGQLECCGLVQIHFCVAINKENSFFSFLCFFIFFYVCFFFFFGCSTVINSLLFPSFFASFDDEFLIMCLFFLLSEVLKKEKKTFLGTLKTNILKLVKL